MNKKQKTLIGIVVAVLLIILAFWLRDVFSEDTITSEPTPEVNVIVYGPDDEELANESFEIEEDTTLLEIMEDNFEITISDDGFVESIAGLEQDPDESLYWIYEVNDEQVEESAEEFVPDDGDIVIWYLMEF